MSSLGIAYQCGILEAYIGSWAIWLLCLHEISINLCISLQASTYSIFNT